MKPKILDNVIPLAAQEALKGNVLDYRFPWHYSPSSDMGVAVTQNYLQEKQIQYDDQNIIDPPQLYHNIFMGSQPNQFFPWFTPLLDAIKFQGMSILRMKMNITFPYAGATESSYGIPHVDLPDEKDYITAVYYVTDADGDTLLFNEKNGHKGKLTIQSRLSPKKGRMLLFEGNTLHAPTPPISNKPRIVVNINIRKGD